MMLFLSVFVFFFSIGALGYAALQYEKGEYATPSFIVFFCFSFSYLLFSSIRTYRKTKDSIISEEIDVSKGTYSISETDRATVTIDLGEFISYKIKKRVESGQGTSSSSGSGRRKYWDLFLLKSDGAYYLLEAYSLIEELKKDLILFRSLFPLPISDDSEQNLKTTEGSRFPTRFETQKPDSKFLKLITKENGTGIEFVKRRTAREKFTIFLVIGIFYGGWGAVFFPINSDPIFLFFMIPFSVLFLGIFTLALVFVITRSLELIVNSSGLRIRYGTTLPILSHFLYLERVFPKHVVRHVRANRLPGDQSVLTVSLKDMEKNSQEKLSFLFNLQTISLSAYVLPGDRELLGVWHLMPWLPDSPGFADLFAAELAIQERMQWDEEKIGFENL
ncbi:hypothetical protein [Leptospira yasudae]|uniref:Uncharacterized protein n=1 Tax=Leptospira yasudae TaxID=2202201 RepID=A0A6N4QDY1_9LEPT|nr:hypothetical protein [Leptospira yasudae]TGL75713.1 hypothetical protein EHQ72_15590 [Leptospira yasudae]TGL78290.1 hypothetical protein EHQ77_12070 [Leptospira yasudae]TGL80054.1 hypothetical protein EHQ83_17285 [Leptospira yasudae]